MNVLITGGAGFIGSHLSYYLANKGFSITAVDNFHPYYAKERKLAQLEIGLSHKNIHFVEGDVVDEDFCRNLFSGGNYDVCIHLAAIPGVSYSLQHPQIYMDINMKGTANVLQYAGKSGIKKIIFASSSSVYGDQAGHPLKEEMVNNKVVSPYAASKIGGEALCHAFHHVYGYSVAVLRFFTVYGPWGRPDMAISSFIRKLLNEEKIPVYGLESARDYTYIDDIVRGIEAVIDKNLQFEAYNLGYGSPVSMTNLIDILRSYFPTMELDLQPWRTGDVQMTWADISKSKRDLGFQPIIPIEEGIARTMEWVKMERQWL